VAAAELAAWLPFLLVLFVVALDFCRIYFTTQTVQNCAHVAALYASGVAPVDSTTMDASTVAVQAALAEGASLNPPLQACDVTVSSTGGVTQASVRYDFAFLMQWPGLGQTVSMTRTVKMATVPAAGN
jgi:Flp pilus assembly protein TadG